MDLRYKKYVGKTTFFFAIFLHKIIPFTNTLLCTQHCTESVAVTGIAIRTVESK